MKFHTEITIPKTELTISYSDRIEMVGSCFVENVSTRLMQSGFHLDVNPFGILYNPVSIANSLYDLLFKTDYLESDLFFFNGIYQSFSHHGRFSGVDQAKVLREMNDRLIQSKRFLKDSSLLIVTFGTAKVYRLLSSGKVVANCHKLPANYFSHDLLSINEIVELWIQLIRQLRLANPKIRILFTISPIRHWKDGAQENQLSKSILFVALNEILRWTEGTYYFPSYEIMMDDLRDYRFYEEDMIHPNRQAINYIWEKFSGTYLNEATLAIAKEWESIRQAQTHRPFNPDSEEYRLFREKTQLRLDDFNRRHPEVNIAIR